MNFVFIVWVYEIGLYCNIGWEIFIDVVIKKLSEECENLVFMLWGLYVKEKVLLIDIDKYLILIVVYFFFWFVDYGFFGCKYFSKVNIFLWSRGIEEIDW